MLASLHRAGHRRLQWQICAFPWSFGPQYLFGGGSLPLLPVFSQWDAAAENALRHVTDVGIVNPENFADPMQRHMARAWSVVVWVVGAADSKRIGSFLECLEAILAAIELAALGHAIPVVL